MQSFLMGHLCVWGFSQTLRSLIRKVDWVQLNKGVFLFSVYLELSDYKFANQMR